MTSATLNASVVQERLQTEVSLGRVRGPLDVERFRTVQVNRFGVIPKNHQPGKWRMIVDLSHPRGESVNDGISSDLCSLHYTSVDEAVKIVLQLGRGARLEKFDIENAYRIVPVHPTDRLLLGMQWEGWLYVDMALPFGLRSAPKIFRALADGLQWILESQGVNPCIHYLDDFMVFGPPDSNRCKWALERALLSCRDLGVPIARGKTEGPSTALTFLGIHIDTQDEKLSLPQEKLMRLKREIRSWRDKRSTTKRELLSLIGQLQHACCIVRPGRSFLQRMISLSTVAKELHHRIRLNRGFQSDLYWWATFIERWNGLSMMTAVVKSPPVAVITSDALGNWGCRAFSNKGAWFQIAWPETWKKLHITVQEHLPVVVGVALWGKQWQGKTILARSDNAAVVAIVKSGSSKDNMAMELVRNLFFVLVEFNILLTIEHVSGIDNKAADALSRENLAQFHLQVPTALSEPTLIPRELKELLLLRRPDWTSKSWINLWQSFLRKDSHLQPRGPTSRLKEDT